MLSVFRGLVLIVAVVALAREARSLNAASIGHQLQSYGPRHIALGAAATVASFLVLGMIEVLGVRAWAHLSRVGTATALMTSFVANALSQSIGVSVLTGAAVRARAYSRDEVGAAAVGRVTAFVTITATLGLIVAGGVALLLVSPQAAIGRFSVAAIPMGLLLLAPACGYLAWSAFGRASHIGSGNWTVERPSAPIALTQLVLSVGDWILAATVLYAFMPSSMGLRYTAVVSGYIIAQLVAVTSHVPAGAGVLEVSILALLARDADAATRAAVAAALVMFRAMYYLLPLLAATLLALAAELRFRTSARGAGDRAPRGAMTATVPDAG